MIRYNRGVTRWGQATLKDISLNHNHQGVYVMFTIHRLGKARFSPPYAEDSWVIYLWYTYSISISKYDMMLAWPVREYR